MTLAELIGRNANIKALGQNYPAIATALNASTTVANPDTTPVAVPLEITLKTLLAIVPAAEGAAIYSKLPGFVDDLRVAISNQDREYLGSLLAIAVAGQAISAETAAKLQPLLTKTVASTPPATIAGPSLAAAAGLPTVTASDVQAADVAGGKWA